MEKITSITIIGRKWFQKTYGNTYFSSIGLINGKQVVEIKFQYGYGSQYEYETFRKMAKEGFIDADNKSVPWSYCADNGIAYQAYAIDVQRKKGL